MTDCVTCNETSGNGDQGVAFKDLHNLKAHHDKHDEKRNGDERGEERSGNAQVCRQRLTKPEKPIWAPRMAASALA